jgi:hypothetical protein
MNTATMQASPELPLSSHHLTPRETKELKRLETIIDAGLRTFLEVGQALLQIRDQRLYRETTTSFDDYCRERWGMSKTHANRLIASATTVQALGDVEITPANEAQVRPLTLLPPDKQPEAWERALASVHGGKVTASVVAAVVEEMLAEGKAKVHQKPVRQVRFVDRDTFVADIIKFCDRHQLVLPKKLIEYLRKY